MIINIVYIVYNILLFVLYFSYSQVYDQITETSFTNNSTLTLYSKKMYTKPTL